MGKKNEHVGFIDARTKAGGFLSEAAFRNKVISEKLICFGKYPNERKSDYWCPSIYPLDFSVFKAPLDPLKPFIIDDMEKHQARVAILQSKFEEDNKRSNEVMESLICEEQHLKMQLSHSSDAPGPSQSSKVMPFPLPRVQELSISLDQDMAEGLEPYQCVDTQLSSQIPPEFMMIDLKPTSWAEEGAEEPKSCDAVSLLPMSPTSSGSKGAEKEMELKVVDTMQLGEKEPENEQDFKEEPSKLLKVKETDTKPTLSVKGDEEQNSKATPSTSLEEDESWLHVGPKGKVHSTRDLILNINKTLQEVQSGVMALQEGMHQVNTSLSMSFEHSCRSSFALLLGSMDTEIQVLYPVIGKRLPYIANYFLESLAEVCLKEGKKPRDIPQEAEIDIFIKLYKEGYRKYKSPIVGQVKSAKVSAKGNREFTNLAIGEVTRSMSLCNNAKDYSHPLKPEISPSSRLLYKFIQLERGIESACRYYAVPREAIISAAVISPSFKMLSEPEMLVDAVLYHCSKQLPNIFWLYVNQRMLLLDI